VFGRATITLGIGPHSSWKFTAASHEIRILKISQHFGLVTGTSILLASPF